jgi:predicted dehydrogenase
MAASVLGLPNAVTGMRGVLVKDYPIPDDNAIIVMKYAHALAVAEASWTQVVPNAEGSNPIAYGSEGSLAVSKGNVIWQRPGVEAETVVPPDLVSPRSSGPEYFVYCIEHSMPIRGLCSPKVSRDAQEILQAGLFSADTGQTITISG